MHKNIKCFSGYFFQEEDICECNILIPESEEVFLSMVKTQESDSFECWKFLHLEDSRKEDSGIHIYKTFL